MLNELKSILARIFLLFFFNLMIFQSLRNLFYIQKETWHKFLEKYIERSGKKMLLAPYQLERNFFSPLGSKKMSSVIWEWSLNYLCCIMLKNMIVITNIKKVCNGELYVSECKKAKSRENFWVNENEFQSIWYLQLLQFTRTPSQLHSQNTQNLFFPLA